MGSRVERLSQYVAGGLALLFVVLTFAGLFTWYAAQTWALSFLGLGASAVGIAGMYGVSIWESARGSTVGESASVDTSTNKQPKDDHAI
jgi:hypothetical protein